jgi:hypothetical protein
MRPEVWRPLYIALGDQSWPLDETDLHVGLRCIIGGGRGSLQRKEPWWRGERPAGLGLGLPYGVL